MPFGKQSPKKTMLIALFLSVIVPLTVFAQSSSEVLVQTKDAFTTLWHSAAETGKRRAVLEQKLAKFDENVASAKDDLLKASNDRRDLRVNIDHHKVLLDALQNQLKAAAESRGFYQSVAVNQKDDIVSFIRYITSKQIALRESGPVSGGALMKRLLRGSLGDTIDSSLAESALLRTRRHFALQIDVLVAEAGNAEERLRKVREDLQHELGGLEEQGKHLSDDVAETAAFIDQSWRQKQLDLEELRHVVQETEETNARIGSMQASLLTINTELQDEQRSTLQNELDHLHASLTKLENERIGYERKQDAMQLLEDAALKAFQVTVQSRNSDPKLYKRIEETQIALKTLQSEYAALPRDASGAVVSAASDNLQSDIDVLTAQIALMKDGVPFDAAADYAQKKRKALEAEVTRKEYEAQASALGPKIALLVASVTSKQSELDLVGTDTGLEGLPPMFSWPVTGPITAGYYDPDYEKVFGVPHRAIDIAVAQATPIHVVSQGVVFAVKDGGATGYSYILVGHQGGYASLYGHVSASFVKAGDKVGYGQIIGLTGGEPGSHGAGHMTTGSHLHLEMMKNGEHINPLSVLPGK